MTRWADKFDTLLFVCFFAKEKIHKNKKRIPQSYHDNNAKQKNEKGIF